MTGASGAVDAAALVATREEFSDAVRHAGTKDGLGFSEATQRRLFGLHARATRGEPPPAPAGGCEEQWMAWREAGGLSELAAMQEYIDTVSRHDPDFVFGADEEMPASELPPALQAQLEASGMKRSPEPIAHAAGDIFEAVRAGAPLAAFLPAHRNAVDDDGLTPLIIAVDSGRAEAVAELLLANASVDTSDAQGATALHYAGLLGAEALAEQLLAAGADPRKVDEDGNTPADAAREEGHEALASAMAEASARFVGA